VVRRVGAAPSRRGGRRRRRSSRRRTAGGGPRAPRGRRLRPRCPSCLFEGFLEVERLGSVAPLAGLETPQQLLHLVLAEAAEREIEIGCRLQVGEEAGQEGVVPGARDLVEGEPKEPGLFGCDIDR
jgi:hypothetical protein